jgi:hypothetical protein
MPDPTLPTIHINGTGAETLRAEYQSLSEALQAAEDRLLAATCNGRDFYPQGTDAYCSARFERSEMLAKLREIMDYANAWRDHASAHCRQAISDDLADQERADA